MLRVYLRCGHTYEVGSLTEAEEKTGKTTCPTCRKKTRIEKAHLLKHPNDSKRRWVEGEPIKLGERVDERKLQAASG
ncbi:MAG: hypothetical protein QXW32_07120 [Nitrososphaerales archaeon]